MAMSRREFNAIAVVIKGEIGRLNPELEKDTGTRIAAMTRNLAHVFSESNPRLDFARFYNACGLTGDGYF